MFKKIAIGTLIVALTGALVVGAIHRTNSKTAASRGNEPAKQLGRSTQVETAGAALERNGGARWQDTAILQGNGSQRGGNRGGQGELENGAEQRGNAVEDESHEWVSLDGAVASVDGDTLVIARPDGEELIVEGRAWRYAQEQGFWTEPGHIIVVNGFYEDGTDFAAGELYDMTAQIEVTMRESSGHPMWSGGYGKGGNRGL